MLRKISNAKNEVRNKANGAICLVMANKNTLKRKARRKVKGGPILIEILVCIAVIFAITYPAMQPTYKKLSDMASAWIISKFESIFA